MVWVRGYGLLGLQTELLFCLVLLFSLYGLIHDVMPGCLIYISFCTLFLSSLYPFLLLVLSVYGQFLCDADVRRRLNGWELFFALVFWVLYLAVFFLFLFCLAWVWSSYRTYDSWPPFSCLVLDIRADY